MTCTATTPATAPWWSTRPSGRRRPCWDSPRSTSARRLRCSRVLSLVERLIEWLAPAYSVAGYAIVAGGVLAERSILLGLFVPGDVILALGGVYAARGDLELWAVILIGTAAAIC